MNVQLYHGDCLDILPTLAESSVDTVVTDPPYDLTGHRWDSLGAGPEPQQTPHRKGQGGFMGKAWDGTGVAFKPATWAEVLRVLKPSGYMLAFGGTRTYHRLACAVEDAGFSIRDCLMWLYGTGFPKGKGCLKPAFEPILLCRKPGAKVKALGIEECRVGTDENLNGGAHARNGSVRNDGWGMKRGGAGEYVQPLGRWPANVIHDGSDEVLEAFAAFGERGGGIGIVGSDQNGVTASQGINKYHRRNRKDIGQEVGFGDTGTAARFFYCAKASRRERGVGNTHPTVKPLALIQWLVKLVCPPDGLVIDPFMGSGTTGVACIQTGRRFIGIEKEKDYFQIAEKRIEAAKLESAGCFW